MPSPALNGVGIPRRGGFNSQRKTERRALLHRRVNPHWFVCPQCGITLCAIRYRDTALSARRADERGVPSRHKGLAPVPQRDAPNWGLPGGIFRGGVPVREVRKTPPPFSSVDPGRCRIGSFVPNAVSHCAQPGIAIPRCRGVTRLPLFVRFSPSPQSADPVPSLQLGPDPRALLEASSLNAPVCERAGP